MKKKNLFLLNSILLLGGISVSTLASCGDVTTKEERFTIKAIVNDESLGEIVVSKNEGVVGEKITFEVNIKNNSTLTYLEINGKSVELTIREFSPLKGPNTIKATFKSNDVPIVIKKGTVEIATLTNGKITANKLEGEVGEEIILTVTPNKEYEIETVKANDKVLTGKDGTYKFNLIEGKNVVTATFKKVETPLPPVEEKIDTFYFSDLNGWNFFGSEARVYLFNDKGLIGEAWPGATLTQFNYGGVGEGINLYKVENLNYTDATHIIFSTGYVEDVEGVPTYNAQHQTIDVDLLTKGANNYYQLTSVDETGKGVGKWLNYATFEETIKASVKLPTTEHGKINAKTLTGLKNDNITLDIVPDEGYELDYIKVNEVDLTKKVDQNTLGFNLNAGENIVTASFKEKTNTPEPTNLKEIYIKTPHWWKKDNANTAIQIFGKDGKTPLNGDLGECISFVSYNGVGDFNYYKFVIDLDAVSYVKFIRVDQKGIYHWGAETNLIDISLLKDNDLFIMEDKEAWKGDGAFANVTFGKYDPSKDPAL